MNSQEKEEIIYRITSSKQRIFLHGDTYILYAPNSDIKLAANELYSNTIRLNRFNDCWLTESSCLALLVKSGICSFDIDKNIKSIEKAIDDNKIKLYSSMMDPKLHKKDRETLRLTKRRYNESITKRHMLDHLTLKGYAEMIKRQFLISHCLYYENGNRVWEDLDETNGFILDQISSEILKQAITPEQIREIARSEPWRAYWTIKKNEVFGIPVFNMTEEQRSLILFSRMYDSAYEHPESPVEDVINDDDLFDGWMLTEQRKNEKDKMTRNLDKGLSRNRKDDKMSKADEIFLSAKDAEGKISSDEIERINNLNDAEGKIIKAQRRQVVKQKGTVKDSEFLDRKVQIQQQSNRQFMETVKGKR